MGDANLTDGHEQEAQSERHSVLAELPRTRPQRPSRRREAARTGGSTASAATPKPAAEPAPKPKPAAKPAPKAKPKTAQAAKRAPSKRSARKPAAAQPPRRRARPAAGAEPVPRQGFEPEEQIAGTPVTPPSGAELVGSLAELAGELAQTGIAAGGRLLRGLFSRNPGS